MKRPIFIATIAYISGVIIGVYLPKSILLFAGLVIILIILKIAKYRHINIMLLFFLILLISAVITLNKNSEYENKFKIYNNQTVRIRGIVVSDIEEQDYKKIFTIKLERFYNEDSNSIVKGTKGDLMLVSIKPSNQNKDINYADEIELTGIYLEPETARNYKGFNYKNYLKTKKVYGTIQSKDIVIRRNNALNFFSIFINNMSKNIIQTIETLMPEEVQGLAIGILIGDKSKINKQTIQNFKESNLSHILAVSGMHVAYVIMSIKLIFNSRWIGINKRYILTIIILIIFSCLAGNTPSVTRAVITCIIYTLAKLLHRKADIINSISITILITLINNPFNIFNIGMQLSYAGTIGILMFYPLISKKVKPENKILKYITDSSILSISANILITPIMMYHFNTISTTFILTNLFAGSIIGIIMILDIMVCVIGAVSIMLAKVPAFILNIFLQILLYVCKIFSKIPISQILVTTPSILTLVALYAICIAIYLLISRQILIKRKTIIKCISILLVITLIFNLIVKIPKGQLIIHFIDVGQGDSTLVITSANKKILIDGGGSGAMSDFDVGEKTLLPYLLDRKIKTIDYIMVSHFDDDHCDGLKAIIKSLKVRHIIVSKQASISNEYTDIMELCKARGVHVIVVKRGDRIKIDKSTYLDIFHPGDTFIDDGKGGLNANAIVAKLCYKLNKFTTITALFTGDIEGESEKELVKIYGDKLKADILKVAHHRFKNFVYTRIFRKSKP